MPYVDVDGVRYFKDREFDHVGAPERVAAEILARAVERFLYQATEPDGKTPTRFYANTDYLKWEVERYDLCKVGSGQPFQLLDYELPHAPDETEPDPEVEA